MSPGKLASTELAVGHARRTLRLAQPQTPAFYPDKGRREAAIPTGPGRHTRPSGSSVSRRQTAWPALRLSRPTVSCEHPSREGRKPSDARELQARSHLRPRSETTDCLQAGPARIRRQGIAPHLEGETFLRRLAFPTSHVARRR